MPEFDAGIDLITQIFSGEPGQGEEATADLAEIEDVGTVSSGKTGFYIPDIGSKSRSDVLVFRRGEIAVFMSALYVENNDLAVNLVDLARLIDQRIMAVGAEE